jgi:hypothetical protein
MMPPGDDIQHIDLVQIDEFNRRCSMNFTDHKALLYEQHSGQRS